MRNKFFVTEKDVLTEKLGLSAKIRLLYTLRRLEIGHFKNEIRKLFSADAHLYYELMRIQTEEKAKL